MGENRPIPGAVWLTRVQGIDLEGILRGTKDEGLYNDFVAAVIGFPPTTRDGKSAKDVFSDSYALLSDVVDRSRKAKDPYARAIAWKAYALALSVYEGWPLPASAVEESKFSDRQKLDEARDRGREAIGIDEYDYDLHWAMADIHLIRQEFADAEREFKTAIRYNRDERNSNLFAEAGSAMMQVGKLDEAEAYFRKAFRKPDWHNWMKGILLFIKAGRESGANRESLLNQALDELTSAHTQLGGDLYQEEIQLLLAAVHWHKWKLLSERAAQTSDEQLNRYAARNLATATRAIREFRKSRDSWSVQQAVTALPLNEQADATYWRDTLEQLWKL